MEDNVKNSASEDVVLSTLVQWYEASEQSTADSRVEAERDRDYYDGYQWTDEEIAKLNKRKQPIVTINRIKPKVDFLLGMERQNRADPRAFPRTPEEEDGANAATDALRYVMDDQGWDRKRSESFENHLIEGACGMDVRVVEKYDGDYCIELHPIRWDRMFGDPHSRERGWNDGKFKGQFLWMDLEDALERWPGKDSALEATIAGEASMVGQTYDDVPRVRWADPKRKRVRVVEMWTKEKGKVYYTAFTKAGILERMESPYVNEDGEQEDGFVFGSCFIDRDGNRYGVVRQWISIQDEINKRRSKAMHLLSVRQVKAEKGAVDDVNKARQELAKPDGYVEVTPGMMFEELKNGDMAAAQFQLLQEAKAEIDSVGVNAALSGNDDRSMSGRALIARSEQGLNELGPVFDNFKQFQLEVYRKVWNRVRQFWTAEKWIRVTDEEKNVKFVGLNQPMTLGEQLLEELKRSGQRITPEMEQQAKMDPQMQTIVGVKNNVAKLDVDIVIDDVPATAALQIEQFQTLADMAKSGVPIPPDVLIESSNLRNKDKILKKMRGEDEQQVPPQIQQEMQAMQEQLQTLQQAAAEEIARRDAEIERLKQDQENKARDLDIKAYQAETDRMKEVAAVVTAEQQAQLATSQDISGSEQQPY